MSVPGNEKLFYSLEELATLWSIAVRDLIAMGHNNVIEICFDWVEKAKAYPNCEFYFLDEEQDLEVNSRVSHEITLQQKYLASDPEKLIPSGHKLSNLCSISSHKLLGIERNGSVRIMEEIGMSGYGQLKVVQSGKNVPIDIHLEELVVTVAEAKRCAYVHRKREQTNETNDSKISNDLTAGEWRAFGALIKLLISKKKYLSQNQIKQAILEEFYPGVRGISERSLDKIFSKANEALDEALKES